MLRLLFTLALGALLSLPVAQAMAFGFGGVSNATVLGQPLNLALGVRLDGDESLVAECISVEVFSGDNRLPASVSIEPGSDPAERHLRVRSGVAIDEPVVSVNVQITCPNRVSRRFVAFIDPPTIDLAQATAPAAASVAPASASARRSEAAAARVAAPKAQQAGSTAKIAAKTSKRPRRVALLPADREGGVTASANVASEPAVRRPRHVSTAGKPARAPPAATGARLRLETADDAATRERLNLRLTGTLAAAPEAAASGAERPVPAIDAEAAQRARERERLQALEDSLTKLRAESQATQASLAQLQLRLREAESQRYSNPLVFALAALATALAAAVAALVWQRRADRRAAAQWWAPPEGASPGVAEADAEPEADADTAWARPEPASRPDRQRASADEPAVVETTASPMMLTQAQALAQAESDALPHAAEPVHEMTVEELIDLEQQAEFFVVLGQDEAAIDLLMGHLRSSGGASPLPYLKLLEIYRRRDEREAYERIRERFNRRFNAYAPDWQSDPQQGRALLDYPNVTASLQALWATPAQTMQALETSLFRRDAGNSTFDLPAYRELLFLYAVARDLAEREAAPASVDLLLPIGGEASDAQPLTRLHPTPAAGVPQAHPAEVDVDITCLDAGLAESDARPSRYLTDFSPTSGAMALAGEPGPKSR